MRKALLCSCLVLLFAVPFAGQAQDWKKYSNSSGNFTVLFPADPQDSVNKKGDGIESHTLLVQARPYVYTVIYTSMDEAQKVDDPTFQVFRDAVFKELPNCQVSQEKPPSPALSGYMGHWYRLACNMSGTNVVVLGNLYWGKHYAYAVMVMFAETASAPATTQKFLDSFGVIDMTK